MRFGLITGLLIPTDGEDTNDEVPQIGKVKEKRVESTGLGEWALESMDFHLHPGPAKRQPFPGGSPVARFPRALLLPLCGD